MKLGVNYTLKHESENLVIMAVACSLRRYLRPLLKHKNVSFAIAIHVPEPEDGPVYEAAARLLFNADKDFDTERYSMTSTYRTVSFDTSPHSLIANITGNSQSIICHDGRNPLNEDVRLMLDFEIEVAHPTAAHYLAAARLIPGHKLSKDDAQFLADQPLRSLRLAMHRFRSMNLVRKKLSHSSTTPPEDETVVVRPDVVTIDKLHGFGEAAQWGLELARDLADWRDGKIEWNDLDPGIVLSGPPGTGKTMFARALADTCKATLYLESAARWQACGHLGDLLKEMRRVFSAAANSRPSIIFLDEFDAFGSRDHGDAGYNHDYKTQVINGLLECLSPSGGRDGVVVVAATNRPGAIDPALLRSGRLERVITIPLPDLEARMAILRHHLVDGDKLDLAHVIKHTRGWSGADLAKLARDAKRISRRRQGEIVTADDLRAAMPSIRYFTSEERFRLAVHEVGHALVGSCLGVGTLLGLRIDTWLPQSNATRQIGEANFQSLLPLQPVEADFAGLITMLLGGMLAEHLVFGGHSTSVGGDASSDLPRATALAAMMEGVFGYGDELIADADETMLSGGIRALPAGLSRAVNARLESYRKVALEVLEPRLEVLRRVGRVLAVEEEMIAARFLELVAEAEEPTVAVTLTPGTAT